VPVLILLFLALWAWAELAVFIAIGSEIGVLVTIIGIAVTAVVGLSLLRSQGRAVMASLQQKVARGEAPVASMADGAAIAAGAVLMLIPGYITDAMGLVLFIPGIRTIIGASLISRMMRRGSGGFSFNANSFGAGSFNAGPFSNAANESDGSDRSDAAGAFGAFHQAHSRQTRHPHGDNPDDDSVIEGDFEEKPVDPQRLDKSDPE
jgi:UPF0716 protein FxsA|tara:strand:- start:341 stop:958 length:618 start_codon:yes stop_codon:yes gene_type:complete